MLTGDLNTIRLAQREMYYDRGTLVFLTAYFQLGAVLLNDGVRGEKAQTGTPLLGGEERVENAIEVFGGYAAAGVGN